MPGRLKATRMDLKNSWEDGQTVKLTVYVVSCCQENYSFSLLAKALEMANGRQEKKRKKTSPPLTHHPPTTKQTPNLLEWAFSFLLLFLFFFFFFKPFSLKQRNVKIQFALEIQDWEMNHVYISDQSKQKSEFSDNH